MDSEDKQAWGQKPELQGVGWGRGEALRAPHPRLAALSSCRPPKLLSLLGSALVAKGESREITGPLGNRLGPGSPPPGPRSCSREACLVRPPWPCRSCETAVGAGRYSQEWCGVLSPRGGGAVLTQDTREPWPHRAPC